MATAVINIPASVTVPSWDSLVRIVGYIRSAERNAQQLLEWYRNHPEDHLDLRQRAHLVRNRLLQQMRSRISPFGRAFSEAIKDEGLSYNRLVERYWARLGNDPAQLNQISEISPGDRFRAAVRPVIRGQQAASWAVARTDYRWELLRLIVRNGSRRVSENIIRASGRTNRLVNILAYTTATMGIAVGITAGGLALAAFAGDFSIPTTILQTLSIPNWQTAVSYGVNVTTALGAGFVTRQVGQIQCIERRSTGVKVGFVVFIQFAQLLLLMALFRLELVPRFLS